MNKVSRVYILLAIHLAMGVSFGLITLLSIFAKAYQLSIIFILLSALNLTAFKIWAKKYKGGELIEEEN